MARVIVRNVMSAVAADTTAVVETYNLTNIGVVCVYARTSGTNNGNNLTITGTFDTDHTDEYIPAVKPTLTGSIDADGVINFVASANTYYQIDGVHQYLKFAWDKTDTTTMTIYVVGLERQ